MSDISRSTSAPEIEATSLSQIEPTSAGTALAERGPVASRRKAMCMSVAALMPSFGTIAEEAREREMWLSLYWEEREAAEAAWEAQSRFEDAEFEVRHNWPKQNIPIWSVDMHHGAEPAEVRWCASVGYIEAHTRWWTKDEINAHYDGYLAWTSVSSSLDAVSEGNEYRIRSLAALDEWRLACEEMNERSGVAALGRLAEAAYGRWEEAERAIVEKPATSAIGVAIKLAFWVACCGADVYDDPTGGNVGERAMLSAWKAAVVLAGLPEEFGAEHHRARHAEWASRKAA